ncbi:hypothetical protein GIB67_016801 [Kingdonia uniflora]|uniref:Uncharacterized protein n=1 Tax=Kingdonia uniflora TaxID=39325 RepID=A0A7J7LS14_9MAGN|nr:hypothetical protein GIB67_016801 [Kingdonia uniflora]
MTKEMLSRGLSKWFTDGKIGLFKDLWNFSRDMRHVLDKKLIKLNAGSLSITPLQLLEKRSFKLTVAFKWGLFLSYTSGIQYATGECG